MNQTLDGRPALAAQTARDLGLKNATPFPNTASLQAQFAGGHHSFYARHQNDEGMALESYYSELHHGKWGLATVSGEAAISLMIRGLTRVGYGVLSAVNIFGTSTNNLKRAGSHDGRNVQFISIHADEATWRSEIKKIRPRIVFLESPSNPLTDLADIPALAQILASYEWVDTSSGEKYKPKLVVDSTFLPPILQKPLDLGADFVIDSLTKFASGDNLATGGMIVGNDPKDQELLFSVRNESGNNITQFNSLVLMNGLQTLSDRILQQSANAMTVARWLKGQSQISGVHYLGLESHPHHGLANSQFVKNPEGQILGYGNMIPFAVRGDLSTAGAIADRTRFAIMANLGLTETIISHPAGSTHFRLSPEERAAAGIGDDLLRLSIGMENPQELIKKLRKALRQK